MAIRTVVIYGAFMAVPTSGSVAKLMKSGSKLRLFRLGHVNQFDLRGGGTAGNDCLGNRVDQLTRCRVPCCGRGHHDLGGAPAGMNRPEGPEVAKGVKQSRVDDVADRRLHSVVGSSHLPVRSPGHGNVASDPADVRTLWVATGTITV